MALAQVVSDHTILSVPAVKPSGRQAILRPARPSAETDHGEDPEPIIARTGRPPRPPIFGTAGRVVHCARPASVPPAGAARLARTRHLTGAT